MGPDSQHDDTELFQVTVNLTGKSYDQLVEVSDATGLRRTEVINRALQIYSFMTYLVQRGDGSLLVTHANGENERFRFG